VRKAVDRETGTGSPEARLGIEAKITRYWHLGMEAQLNHFGFCASKTAAGRRLASGSFEEVRIFEDGFWN
jgi:hypothetical protein